jgi:hypothetical protein
LAKHADTNFIDCGNGKVIVNGTDSYPSVLKPSGYYVDDLKVDGKDMTTDLVCMTDLNNY